MNVRPEKGTPEFELWIAAIEVAIYPPINVKTATSKVSAKRIRELRSALDLVGVDWRQAKAITDERRRHRAQNRRLNQEEKGT